MTPHGELGDPRGVGSDVAAKWWAAAGVSSAVLLLWGELIGVPLWVSVPFAVATVSVYIGSLRRLDDGGRSP